MKSSVRNGIRAVVFLVILVLLLSAAARIVTPVIDNVYDTENGFYKQPENTIEVAFIGTSVFRQGIIPAELYEDYGICAWNFGTSGQPLMMSYYWLQEVYDYHSESLTAIVLDVSSLQHDWEEAKYQTALLEMRTSVNKYHAVKDITDTLEDFLAYMIPMVTYHTRWKELEEEDFSLLGAEPDTSMRGYDLVTEQRITSASYEEAEVLTYLVTSDETAEFEEEGLTYLYRIIEFCQANDLELILTRTPTNEGDWGDAAHNAVQQIADDYGLTFVDFNYIPYSAEIEYNGAVDKADGKHLNYYGAQKLTAWFGEYLSENCGVTDVRGTDAYAFMEAEVEEYHRNVLSTDLADIVDPADYIETVSALEGYTILISVCDEATNALTQEQRDHFAQLGLDVLAELEYHDSALAVVEDGEVVWQERDEASSYGNTTDPDAYLEYTGFTMDGSAYTLRSGGALSGSLSSCIINGTDYSLNSRGINITIYDNETGEVTESVVFDTYDSSCRDYGNVKTGYDALRSEGTPFEELDGVYETLYLYNLRAADVYYAKLLRWQGDATLTDWLEMFSGEDYVLVLAAQGDISEYAAAADVEILEDYGLEILCTMTEDTDYDAYVAVIDGGEVIAEEAAEEYTTRVEVSVLGFLEAGSGDVFVDGNLAYARVYIDGTDYSAHGIGLNLVIYDKITGLVVDAVTIGDPDAYSEELLPETEETDI